jgi:hypothetical protein
MMKNTDLNYIKAETVKFAIENYGKILEYGYWVRPYIFEKFHFMVGNEYAFGHLFEEIYDELKPVLKIKLNITDNLNLR